MVEQILKNLKDKTAVVVGAGGLGGFVLEQLARLNFKEIRIADADVFCPSNLDRQLYSNINNIGQFKAEEAAKRLAKINETTVLKTFIKFFDGTNLEILNGADMVFDCTDNTAARLKLETACQNLNIPLMHGAIDGYLGQVSLVLPKDNTITKLYANNQDKKAGKTMAHIPAAVASLMVNEAVKHFGGLSTLSGGYVLLIDFSILSFDILKI
jgi:molybdopterin/thiamine biosynthesis adenylyltransferase